MSIFLANFTAADNTDLATYTPDIGPVGSALQGTFKILSNLAQPNSNANGDCFAWNLGRSDFTLNCNVKGALNGGNIQSALLIFRCTDVNNFWWWYWQWDNSANNFQLLHRIAGVDTAVVTTQVGGGSGVTYPVQIVCNGPRITINQNNVGPQIDYSGATFNQTATKFGLYLAAAGAINPATWGALSVDPLVQSQAPGYTTGPPDPRTPYFRLAPVIVSMFTPPPAPVQVGTQTYGPGFTQGPPDPRTPYFQIPPPILPQITPPPVPPTPTPFPGYTSGPPDPRMPWFRLAPVVPVQIAPPAAPNTAQSYMPGYTTGPPMPGAPWFQGQPPPPPLPSTSPPVGGPTPTPPHPEFPSHSKPFIARVPDVENRLRRFTETLTNCFNSLVGQGYIMQLGSAKYQIIGGGFVAARNPGPTDDLAIGANPGCTWVNTVTNTAFICVSNGPASAVWAQAGGGGGGGGGGGSGLTGTFP